MIENNDICEICDRQELVDIYPVEMMHGIEGPFHYVHCDSCGSTYQPQRLGDYSSFYPKTYYSFQYKEPESFSARLRQLKRKLRNRYYYFSKGFIGKLLSIARPCPTNHLSRHVKLEKNMSILEVGSGSGELLHELADLGLQRVVGIDPFIEKDIFYKNGATVLKASINDIQKLLIDVKFDLIIFNHSLEHSPTPINDLKSVTEYLKSNGVILIRIPVSNSALEKKYGIHWWALDAPRHIYLFSAQSIHLLAKKCGLTVKSTHFEGTIDDFLASEQHKAGISLLNKDSYVITKNLSSFSPEQLKTFEVDIESQNTQGTASQAGFVLGF